MKSKAQEVGSRIKQAMGEAGYGSVRLAKAMRCSRETVWKWTVGQSEPDVETMERLAGVLGKTVAWFYQTEEASGAVEQAVALLLRMRAAGADTAEEFAGYVRGALSEVTRRNLPAVGKILDEEAMTRHGRLPKDLSENEILDLALYLCKLVRDQQAEGE